MKPGARQHCFSCVILLVLKLARLSSPYLYVTRFLAFFSPSCLTAFLPSSALDLPFSSSAIVAISRVFSGSRLPLFAMYSKLQYDKAEERGKWGVNEVAWMLVEVGETLPSVMMPGGQKSGVTHHVIG